MKVCSSMKQMMLHLLTVRCYFHVEGVPQLRYVFVSCLHHLGRWWWVETSYLLKFVIVYIPLCWSCCLIIIFFWKSLFNIFHARVSIKNGKFQPSRSHFAQVLFEILSVFLASWNQHEMYLFMKLMSTIKMETPVTHSRGSCTFYDYMFVLSNRDWILWL